MNDQTSTISGDKTEFRKALEHAINCHSMENGSNSPDFVLAQYMEDCLAAFDKAVQHRDAWYESLVSLPLSLALLEKLNEVLRDHQDEGPFGEGWASTELKELRSLTDKALKGAKAG